MEKLKEIVDWFTEEWLIVFFFGGFFALVFWDIKMMGYFVAGALFSKFFRHK